MMKTRKAVMAELHCDFFTMYHQIVVNPRKTVTQHNALSLLKYQVIGMHLSPVRGRTVFKIWYGENGR